MVSVLKSLFSKEAVLALVLGLVTNRFFGKKTIQNTSSSSATSSSRGERESVVFANPPKLVTSEEVYTPDEISDLLKVWQDNEVEGKLLQGRHGVTHYIVDRSKKSNKGMVILCHGLGQSLKMYKEFADILIGEGYVVLRYDYFGHGYSKYTGKDMWVKYTTDMFVDQLEDLIDFVTKEENEEVVAFVGHSNGGVVGLSANYRWSTEQDSKRKVLPKLILANPAVYTSKPLLAKISDQIPVTMTALMKTIPVAKSLIGDNYMDSISIAFGKRKDNGEYLFPEAFKASIDSNKRLFGKVKGIKQHPFLAAAILGVSSYAIPDYLLPNHREKLATLARGKEGQILYLWGDYDVLVPYEGNVDEIQRMTNDSDIMELKVMKNISHECFLENTNAVADALFPFLRM